MAIRALALVILVGMACAPAGPQVDVEVERNAVLEADRSWSKTPPDADAFASFFTPDAVNLVGGAPAAQGIQAIRIATRELFGTPDFQLSWKPSRAEVSACGDLAYTVGAYEIGDGDATRPGKYATVWKKQPDGAWKVVVDAASEDAPPPVPPLGLHLETDSVDVDPAHYEVAFENDRARVLRIHYGPNEKSVMHEHPAGVIVYLSDQNVRFTLPDGTTSEVSAKAGEIAWTEAGAHLPENLADGPLDVVLVELKTARD